jgi:polyhydroxybutyrate depolymerase
MMVWFSGLNKKSDEAGFIVVYPSGTGTGPLRTWNAGGFRDEPVQGKADDVAFVGKLLDDLGTVVKIDEKRVYACGVGNGGMMCYRLAAALSDRIAAFALEESKPKRPVPVIRFHGTKDTLVPFEMENGKTPAFMKLKGVEESVQTWVKLNGCDERAKTETISKDGDEMKVTRKTYSGGKDGAEIVLIVIEQGGHTWPGRRPESGLGTDRTGNLGRTGSSSPDTRACRGVATADI